jgi:hypothetical protein
MSNEKNLISLNEQSVDVEQRGGDDAHKFFDDLLSKQLLFRRANGRVVDKCAFLDGLKQPGPFSSRSCGNISVTPLDERTLVTLIVTATRADDATEHRYRNIRLFSRASGSWVMELWYNYEIAGL